MASGKTKARGKWPAYHQPPTGVIFQAGSGQHTTNPLTRVIFQAGSGPHTTNPLTRVIFQAGSGQHTTNPLRELFFRREVARLGVFTRFIIHKSSPTIHNIMSCNSIL